MNPPNNFPAFPVCFNGLNDVNQGITARDLFAAFALAGSVANPETTSRFVEMAQDHGMKSADLRAKYCYELADAFLAERSNAISSLSVAPRNDSVPSEDTK